jgi:hypothetical protein
VTVKGQQAIDALRTNQSFKTVGVALRNIRPSNEVLGRAAERLTDISGDPVIPLEDDISKAATKSFPQLQRRYGPLATRLEALGLPGVEKVGDLTQELADVLSTDGSDAPQRLGGVESALYDRLRWAREVDTALKNGLEPTVRELQQHRQEISALPDSDVPGQLRADLAGELDLVGQRLAYDGFAKHAADLRSALTTIKARVAAAAEQMAQAQSERLKEAQQELEQLGGWGELTLQEQSSTLGEIDTLAIVVSHDLQGIKRLLSQDFTIQSRLRALKQGVEHLGNQRRSEREDEERRKREEEERAQFETGQTGESGTREKGLRFVQKVQLRPRLRSVADLDTLISQLQELREKLLYAADVDVTIELEN